MWHLSVFGFTPFLAGLLLVFLLKSKLTPTVLWPWFITLTTKNINNDAVDRHRAPFPLATNKSWHISSDYCPYEYRSSASFDGRGLVRRRLQPKIALADNMRQHNNSIWRAPCPQLRWTVPGASGDHPRCEYGSISTLRRPPLFFARTAATKIRPRIPPTTVISQMTYITINLLNKKARAVREPSVPQTTQRKSGRNQRRAGGHTEQNKHNNQPVGEYVHSNTRIRAEGDGDSRGSRRWRKRGSTRRTARPTTRRRRAPRSPPMYRSLSCICTFIFPESKKRLNKYPKIAKFGLNWQK